MFQVLPPEEIDRELEHMEKYHARAPPEQNFEIKSMHIHQSDIPGVEKITMPVVSRQFIDHNGRKIG